MSRIISERESLKAKMSGLKQEKLAIQDKLKQMESLKLQVPADQRVLELQGQVSSLQQLVESLRRDKDDLAEANNEYRRRLEMTDVQYRDMDTECQR